MSEVFDSDLRRLGVLGSRRPLPPAKKQLSSELVVIVLGILLPIGVLCWRVVADPLSDKAILSLDWPEGHRPGATVELNGVAQKIPLTGELDYTVQPGEIRISIDAPGCMPFEQTIFAKAKRNTLVNIPWDELNVARQSPDAGSQQAAKKASPAPATIVANVSPPTVPAQVESRVDVPSPVSRAVAIQNNIVASSPPSQAIAATAIPGRAVALAPAVPAAPAGKIVPAGRVVPVRNVVLAVRGNSAAGVALAEEKRESTLVEVPGLDRSVGSFAFAGSPALTTAPDLASALMKPIEIAADAETDRLVSEAWGLIERGDYELGRSMLLKAREHNRTDPRADFSLGLLDGMVNGDWAVAEKRFSDCVRRNPDNVPLLNNLAIAQLHNKHEIEAAKHWKTIVGQHAATAEVVQNLGRARYLIKLEDSRKNAAVLKTLDDLYTGAAVAVCLSARPEAGFRIMGLLLADGSSVGWANPRRMIDTSPLTNTSANSSSRATASGPGAAIAGNTRPGTGAAVSNDPRSWPSGGVQPGAYPPGSTGYGAQAPNAPTPLRYGRTR